VSLSVCASVCVCERERDRDRDRDRETERQRDRETERQRDRETEREREGEREREKQGERVLDVFNTAFLFRSLFLSPFETCNHIKPLKTLSSSTEFHHRTYRYTHSCALRHNTFVNLYFALPQAA